MRIVAIALLAAALTGCVTVTPGATDSPSAGPPTGPPQATNVPIATPEPTLEQTPTPAPETTPIATLEPAQTPSGTPDPNATPRPTVVDLLPYLSSQVTVVNLGDQTLTVTVTFVDPDSTESFELGTFDVQSLQVTTQSIIPSRFRLEFDYAGGPEADAGTCTVDIAENEQIQFALIPGGGAIATGAGEPDDPAELLVATSARCHAGAST